MGRERVIPLVEDPAIQTSEWIVQHCEQLAGLVDFGDHSLIERRQTRTLQLAMANLCESLEMTWDVLHTKTAKDTSLALVIQRQFLTRYKKCHSRFIDVYWCLVSCSPIHDSPQYGFQAWLDCAARGEPLSKAVSDHVLAEGFTPEAYEQLNMKREFEAATAAGVAAQGKSVNSHAPKPKKLAPRVKKAADQLRDFLKKSPRLLKGNKTKRQVHDAMGKAGLKVADFNTWHRYITEAIRTGELSEFQPGCPGFLPRRPPA
jgi:hypothetical protein